MYDDNNWSAVTGEELTGFLEQINPIDGKYAVSAETTQVGWRNLPFYDQVALIRVTDPSWANEKLTIFYLTAQGSLFRLDGTSPPIHEINAKAPIKVKEENVLDYLRFFSFFVIGEEGPFLIAEDMENPDMPRNMDAECRRVFESTIRPASFEGKNEQGFFVCNAVVFYSNTLSIVNFVVKPSGIIEIPDHEMVAADLPVKASAQIT